MFEKMFDQAVAWVFDAGINLLVALIILLIGLKVIKKVRGILDHTMEKAGVDIAVVQNIATNPKQTKNVNNLLTVSVLTCQNCANMI